jgi:uncharacterized protein (DUF2384 family)
MLRVPAVADTPLRHGNLSGICAISLLSVGDLTDLTHGKKTAAGSAQRFTLRYILGMPVSTAEKVVALSKDLHSQRQLAELLDVSPAQVTRWRRGKGIDEVNARRVDLLELVMASLLRLYSAETAEAWLRGLNPYLGGRRPIDLVRAGRTVELLGALAQERAGSFA